MRSALHSEEVDCHGAKSTMAITMHTCVLTAVEALLHKVLWIKAQKHNQDRAHSIHLALAASSRRHGNADIHNTALLGGAATPRHRECSTRARPATLARKQCRATHGAAASGLEYIRIGA